MTAKRRYSRKYCKTGLLLKVGNLFGNSIKLPFDHYIWGGFPEEIYKKTIRKNLIEPNKT